MFCNAIQSPNVGTKYPSEKNKGYKNTIVADFLF